LGKAIWDGRVAGTLAVPQVSAVSVGRLEGEFGTGLDAKLGEDVFEVSFDGGSAHDQAFGDL
jgi:hypothetical protein